MIRNRTRDCNKRRIGICPGLALHSSNSRCRPADLARIRASAYSNCLRSTPNASINLLSIRLRITHPNVKVVRLTFNQIRKNHRSDRASDPSSPQKTTTNSQITHLNCRPRSSFATRLPQSPSKHTAKTRSQCLCTNAIRACILVYLPPLLWRTAAND